MISTTVSEYNFAYWSSGSGLVDGEGEREGLTLGEHEPRTTFKNEKRATRIGLGSTAPGALTLRRGEYMPTVRTFSKGVVALDEAPRSANHEEPHEFAPVIGMLNFSRKRQDN